MNEVVRGQVKSENSSLPVAVRVTKTRVLKLPIELIALPFYDPSQGSLARAPCRY